jgi:hypothetical protein
MLVVPTNHISSCSDLPHYCCTQKHLLSLAQEPVEVRINNLAKIPWVPNAVAEGWQCELQHADAFRTLDHKICSTQQSP